jgi:hypothetical protein
MIKGLKDKGPSSLCPLVMESLGECSSIRKSVELPKPLSTPM